MREIKFRAWENDSKKWLTEEDGLEINLDGSYVIFCDAGWYIPKITIEQYTGLKDKNGKEIYEGDIVEALIVGFWETGGKTVCFRKAKWRLEVLYNDIRFMDVVRVIGSKNCPDRIYYLFDEDLSDIKVIGNIHENPELLEAKE